MTTTEAQTVAAGHSVDVDPARWQELFDELLGRVAGRFARVDLRRRARGSCAGCWPTCHARTAGRSLSTPVTTAPTGWEHLLARAVWDEDAVRDDLRGYVVEHLRDPGAVLVVDETGDLKKGTGTVGSSASTPAPLGGWRTPRSRSTWSTPPMPRTP